MQCRLCSSCLAGNAQLIDMHDWCLSMCWPGTCQWDVVGPVLLLLLLLLLLLHRCSFVDLLLLQMGSRILRYSWLLLVATSLLWVAACSSLIVHRLGVARRRLLVAAGSILLLRMLLLRLCMLVLRLGVSLLLVSQHWLLLLLLGVVWLGASSLGQHLLLCVEWGLCLAVHRLAVHWLGCSSGRPWLCMHGSFCRLLQLWVRL